MNAQAIIAAIWAAVNTPFGITTVAALVLWALNKLYAKRPLWEAYEGTIISAVRLAEKNIPDDTKSAGIRRLDAALKYVLNTFEHINGRRSTDAEATNMREGIQIVHNDLDTVGALDRQIGGPK